MSIIKINGVGKDVVSELTNLANDFVENVDNDIGYSTVIAKNGGDMPKPMILAHEVRERVDKLSEYYLNHGNVKRMDVWVLMSTYDLITDMIKLSYNSVTIISQIIVILDILKNNKQE